MAEIPFEVAWGALEATRGTAIAAPTHNLLAPLTITPKFSTYRPDEVVGRLAEYGRTVRTKQHAEWKVAGPCDPRLLPFWLEMALAGTITPAKQGATAAYLSTYAPSMTTDTLKSATLWGFDANITALEAKYAMCDELVIRSDMQGESGLELDASGWCQVPVVEAAPTAPPLVTGDLIMPQTLQLYMDTATIGTTEVTGRVLSAELTIRTGVTYKWLSQGSTFTTNDYTRVGRKKRHCELKLVLEVPDTVQLALALAGTYYKTRVKWSGALIETPHKWYVQADIYGSVDVMDWGVHAESNRTLALTILSQYDATATHDLQVLVMHNSATV